MHTAIMAWTAENRVSKMLGGFDTVEDAQAHIDSHPSYNGFVVETPSEGVRNWLVDPDNRTITISAPEPTASEVNMQRDRRIEAGFIYGGSEFQSDKESRENLVGAQGLSLGAMIADPGGDAGLRWADPNVDFTWTDSENNEVPMTASECQAFCQAAMQYKSEIIKAARSLKNMQPTPQDYADDRHWPSRTID